MRIITVLFLLCLTQTMLVAQFTTGGFDTPPVRFDGYTTEQEIDVDIPENGNFTIESWIAPVEYSFNISAIINRQQNFQRGFLLGINHLGQLVGCVAADGIWHTCLSSETIPLALWSHIAMSYTQGIGLKLYVNGKLSNQQAFSGIPDLYPQGTILLGRTQEKMASAFTERETSARELSAMRYNGLIGGLTITAKALSGRQIQKRADAPAMAGRRAIDLPSLPAADIPMGTFGAFYTRLDYAPGWDALWRTGDESDVVVRFPDKPVKYVFWRGAGYIPAVVTENNIWMSDQSVENFATGECFEAMGDKQCRYSHVRILESTPARCVVHWRYALVNIDHRIYGEDENGWGDWVDEYWTIYPDGIAVRKQVLHSPVFAKSAKGYQFQETIFFNRPGTRPQDNIEMDAITFGDMDGNAATYNWEEGPPKKFDKSKYQPIQLINLKSRYKPFSIFHPERITKPFSFGWTEGYSTFPCWNHWPVSQIKSDGRSTSTSDRTSHSSLAETTGNMQIVEFGPDNTAIARQMIGMTTGKIENLLPLAQSWNNAPGITVTEGDFTANGYDVYQRVYLIGANNAAGGALGFTIHADRNSPVHHMAVEVGNWDRIPETITLNGMELKKGKDYFTGCIPTLEGAKTVIWIYCVSTDEVRIRIK